jgi:hypothetical protein
VIRRGISQFHITVRSIAKVYQLLAHGRWFSPGTPASSITKTGRYDIAELILLKVALNTKNQIKSIKVTGKLYHLRLRVECTLFVIYKAGREPTPYW